MKNLNKNQTKKIIVFKLNEDKKRFLKSAKIWSASSDNLKMWAVYNKPTFNRLDFLKENGIDTTELNYLLPSERVAKADEMIQNSNFEIDFEVAEATITALETPRNKTRQAIFDDFSSFDFEGKMRIKGNYNQSLEINVELKTIKVKPEYVNWEEEGQYQFLVNPIADNNVVVRNDVTFAGNKCYSLAIGCVLEDEVLKIGSNAKFYFNGYEGMKEVDFDYHFSYNQNGGKSIQLPNDLDPLSFSFNYYWWEESIAEGNYVKKDAVYIAKTNNGNYVVFQNHPRRAIVVLENNEIIEKNDAQWGNANVFATDLISLKDYKKAIEQYEVKLHQDKEALERRRKEQLAELYEQNEGWYIVELPCCQNDFKRGGHREVCTNWKILSNSKMKAYEQAVKCAENKGYFFFAEAIHCQIDYFGVWTDEKEDFLKDEGLI